MPTIRSISIRRIVVTRSTIDRPAGRQPDHRLASVHTRRGSLHELLRDQTVAETGCRRVMDSYGMCKISDGLRTSCCENHEGSVLGQRHVVDNGRQRPGRHAHERRDAVSKASVTSESLVASVCSV